MGKRRKEIMTLLQKSNERHFVKKKWKFISPGAFWRKPLFLFYFSISIFFNLFAEPSRGNKTTLENFEDKDSIFKMNQANDNISFRISNTLTSPNIISNKSVLIRIENQQTKEPLELYFNDPYVREDYLIEMEFNIYSNHSNSDLYILIKDSTFTIHKIKISSLNFEGWKQITVPIKQKIHQTNKVVFKNTQIIILGLLYIPSNKDGYIKEDLIALDDIIILTRKKKKLPEDPPENELK